MPGGLRLRTRRRRRAVAAAPDRYLTHAERLAVRTSRRWVAGYPNLVAQWHPRRNVDLYPYEVPTGSQRRVWWKCPHGPDHEWIAAVQNRVPKRQRPKGSGCPFCAGKRISVTNCLATTHPKMASEWHATKNGKLTAGDVMAGDERSVWWKCPRGRDHIFRQTIATRSKGRTGCPFCRNRQLSVTNSLAAKLPELAREWHPTKNGKLTAHDVRAADVKRPLWWLCSRAPGGRGWRATIAWRLAGAKCPFCTSFAAKYPKLLQQWHPTKNGRLEPWAIKPSSRQSVWWKCSRAKDHQWRTSVAVRVSEGTGCPFCARRAVSSTNSLAKLFPAIAKQWHPKKNGSDTAASIAATLQRKAWWRCRVGHEWEASIGARTRRGIADCPVCEGRRASRMTSLAATHPEIAALWHPRKNDELRPEDVTAKSDRAVWWKCPDGRDHQWTDRVRQRVAAKLRCPFCAHRRRSITNRLARTAPELARQWHPTKNGKLTPADVQVTDTRRVWWKCKAGPDHEWQTRLDQRVRSGRGCPFCGGWRLSVTNSFGARHPELARQLHPTRNGSLDPMRVKSSSTQRVWWTCPTDASHVWRTTFHHRVARRQGCPECARARLR